MHFAILALSAVVLASPFAAAQSIGSYAPVQGTLPESQGWSLEQTGSPVQPTVAGGLLLQGPTEFSEYQYWERFDIDSDFSSPAGMRVEVDVQVVQSTYGPGGFANTWRTGFMYLMTDRNGRVAAFGVSDGGVRLSVGANLDNSASSPFIPLDTTSESRLYGLTANSSGVSLRVDGALIATIPLGATTAMPNWHYFGDGTSGGNCEVQLAHTSWSNSDGPGTPYCGPAVVNSTGGGASIECSGSASVAANDLELIAGGLPLQSSGIFLASLSEGYVVGPGGSMGSLCLGSNIGRFIGPGQVGNSGATGSFRLAVDLTQIPTPMVYVAVQPGSTWRFAAWYRDNNPVSTSNFTPGIKVTFTP